MNRRRSFAIASLAAALFAFWLLLSGIYTYFLVSAGACASMVVAALASRMRGPDLEEYFSRSVIAVVTYWPWLLKEMLASGWRVALIILSPRLEVSPALTRFRPSQATAIGIATHANSITLTPGTITVSARRDEFLVHALTREAGRGLAGSEMDRRVRALEASP